MLEHTDIWNAIDCLAQTHGYSASGLAKKANLDPTTFNKSKRISDNGKPRWPSTESIAKILAVTGTTMQDFLGVMDAAAAPPSHAAIPLIGIAQAGRKGYFDEDGYPAGKGWDEIDFSFAPGKMKKFVFALEVTGDSMMPLYRDKDILIVSPEDATAKGDRVIVKTKNGEVMAKELARKTAKSVTLSSLNPDHEDCIIPLADIGWIAKILWVSQ
jgi:phage repressor protein C with HTH and peptisase S24 domain